MRFVYVGKEEETSAFGLMFPRGVPVEVSEDILGGHAARKLSNNHQFAQELDGVQVCAASSPQEEVKKRRGRPPKAK